MLPVRPTLGETARILVLSLIDAVGDAFDAAGRGLDGIGSGKRRPTPTTIRAKPCDYCDGARLISTGHVMDTEPCPRCGGSGVEPQPRPPSTTNRR